MLGAREATQGEGDVAEHACKEYTNRGGIRRRTAWKCRWRWRERVGRLQRALRIAVGRGSQRPTWAVAGRFGLGLAGASHYRGRAIAVDAEQLKEVAVGEALVEREKARRRVGLDRRRAGRARLQPASSTRRCRLSTRRRSVVDDERGEFDVEMRGEPVGRAEFAEEHGIRRRAERAAGHLVAQEGLLAE